MPLDVQPSPTTAAPSAIAAFEAAHAAMNFRARLAAMPAAAVFTTSEAAAHCGMGASTWERMRMAGETPAAIRLTSRTLGYRKRVLDAWLDARTEHRAA